MTTDKAKVGYQTRQTTLRIDVERGTLVVIETENDIKYENCTRVSTTCVTHDAPQNQLAHTKTRIMRNKEIRKFCIIYKDKCMTVFTGFIT